MTANLETYNTSHLFCIYTLILYIKYASYTHTHTSIHSYYAYVVEYVKYHHKTQTV